MLKELLEKYPHGSQQPFEMKRYFDEINADPIVYHWTYKMDEIDPDEAVTINEQPVLFLRT